MASSLRRNESGRVGVILVALGVAAVVLVSILVLGIFTTPHMNECNEESVIAWGQGFGTYSVSQFIGRDAGVFDRLDVVITPVEPEATGQPAFLGFLEEHGDAWVTVTVMGPGAARVVSWESEKHHFDFATEDLAAGTAKQADFETGLVCYVEKGTSDWSFTLTWDSGDGPQELAREHRTAEV